MPRPRKNLLTVGLKKDGASWRLRWGRGAARVSFSIGVVDRETALRRQVTIQDALNGEIPWPRWALDHRQVRAYVHGHAEEIKGKHCGDLYAAYSEHLGAGNVTPGWRRCCLGALRELKCFAAERGEPSLERVTPATAQAFINYIPTCPGPFQKRRKNRSPATANRALASANGFYSWCMRLGYMGANPFAGVKELIEEDAREIVFLSLQERNEVLAAAGEEEDGIAIWLALLAGMRRSEIARLDWDNVSLINRKITVINTKTPKKRRTRRTVDMAEHLQKQLEKTMPARRKGRVVPWPTEYEEWKYQATEIITRLRARLEAETMRRNPKASKRTMKKRTAWIQKVGWNNMRHTFCTLLAQAGVPPFVIIGWSGHSMKVFMKHYAAHMPDYDDRINTVDRLQEEKPKKKRKA